jgi:hypothetical protein
MKEPYPVFRWLRRLETGKEKHLMHAETGRSAIRMFRIAALLMSLMLMAGSAWAQSSQ